MADPPPMVEVPIIPSNPVKIKDVFFPQSSVDLRRAPLLPQALEGIKELIVQEILECSDDTATAMYVFRNLDRVHIFSEFF
jgi:hypothetical protein